MNIKEKFVPIFLNTGATALSSLLVLVVASRFLTIDSYGIYRQFYLVCELAAPILGLGLAQSIYKYFSVGQKKSLLLTSLGSVLGLSVIFWFLFLNPIRPLLFEVISGNNLKGLEYLALVYLFSNISLPILLAFYVDSRFLTRYTLYNSLHVVISSAVVSVIAIVFNDYKIMLYSRTVFLFVFIMVAFYFCLQFVRDDSSAKRIGMIDLCKFSIPVGIASAVGIFSQHIDKVIVSLFEAPEQYAVYVNGAMELPLISIITGALGTASLVHMSKLCNDNHMNSALLAFHQIALLSSLVLFPIFVFFLINAHHFMIALFGERFVDSAIPFRIYLCLLPIRVVFYGTALVALGYTKVIMVRSLVELVLNIILSFLLYRQLGVVGVALASVITVYFWSVPFNLKKISSGFRVKLWQVLPLKQLGVRLLIAILCSPAAYFPAKLSGVNHSLLVMLINGVFYSLFVFALYCLFKYINIRSIIMKGC